MGENNVNEIEIKERLVRIETKLDNVNKVTEMSEDNKNEVILLKEQVKNQQKQIEELKETNKLLVKAVSGFEEQTKNQQKQIDEMRDNNKWLARAITGAVITSIVVLVFVVIRVGLGI